MSGLAAPLAAQEPTPPPATPATIVGRVIAGDDGEPIRFSLIYLVHPDSTAPVAATLTDGDGGFFFRDVPAGEYRLRVDRIGYEPEPGRPFRLSPGERYAALLSSSPRPVAIAPIIVSGEACYGAGELDEAPELAKLWREAAKVAEARRLFDRAYRYTMTVRQVTWAYVGVRRVVRQDTERVVTRDPVRVATVVEQGSTLGYGVLAGDEVALAAPELPELFGPAFLRTHCLQPESDHKRQRRIGFRPLSADSERVEIRGTVVLDSMLLVDRLEFQYLHGEKLIAEGVLRFGDVPVLGGRLRFARRLEVRGTLAGGRRWRATADVRDYRGFVRDSSR